MDKSKENNYFGIVPKDANGQVSENIANFMSPPMLYVVCRKLGYYPCSLTHYRNEWYIPYKNVRNILEQRYKHDFSNDIIDYTYRGEIDDSIISSHACEITDGVFMWITANIASQLESNKPFEHDYEVKTVKYYHVVEQVKLYFLPEKANLARELMNEFTSIRLIYIIEKTLSMICKDYTGRLYTTVMTIKSPIIKDLGINYGNKFPEVHEKIKNELKKPESTGIILLHGLPGSGKTNYIRYLIHEITDKQIIYVPPDLTTSIASPEFLPFMLTQKDSILIIEDAENIIKSRGDEGVTNQAVANLLNLSDGLLGDSLHQPIIATFNCELKSIDAALLRKGRLIVNHEFGKLDIECAQNLSDSIGFNTKITEPMTLADIYGQNQN